VVDYDPVAGEAAEAYASAHLPNLKVASDTYEALRGAHAAVVVTEWEEIRNLDLEWAAALMVTSKVLVDGRNAVDPEEAGASGAAHEAWAKGKTVKQA
jgi:UDPglucose 6-dehydrogenase